MDGIDCLGRPTHDGIRGAGPFEVHGATLGNVKRTSNLVTTGPFEVLPGDRPCQWE